MRIAIVAPLFECIPPVHYGGTERVVSYLAEELVRLGHTVTLYASRGSITTAQLVECYPGTLREQGIGNSEDETRDLYSAQLRLACSGLAIHDIIHVHHGSYGYHTFLVESIRNVPIVWTDHGAIHTDGISAIFKSLANFGIGFTALSDSHRSTLPDANWLATIHHGLPIHLLTPKEVNPTYVAFLGRICPEKGITTAVRITDLAGMHLKVAAKVDKVDQVYYKETVKPVFEKSKVTFIGEISEQEKIPFLSGAIALIFPICWLEPFGLVMIEAMACGCPIVAFKTGSVSEIVEDGITGFVVETEEEARKALLKVGSLDRARIRQRFEERFTSTTMAAKYLEVYQNVIKQAKASRNTEEPIGYASIPEARDPVTIGTRSVLGSSQLSVLGKVGRKYLQKADEAPNPNGQRLVVLEMND